MNERSSGRGRPGGASAGLQPATFALNEGREIEQWQRPTKPSAKCCG
jgi:hypothetical protein